MAQYDHIAIIGVGLIGASFAMAVRAAGFDGRITGWDRPDQLAAAAAAGIIDGVEESFAQGTKCSADLIYLALPIKGIIGFLQQRGAQIKAGALVTDSGSTKRAICQAAAQLPREINFIGGHPMAGSQHRGLTAARADLFRDAVYLLVAPAGQPETPLLQFEFLLREIGARPERISAETHDEAIALVSHLPQLVSTALADITAAQPEARRLAGPGFRDMTRLASSSWAIWQDICGTNRDHIAGALTQLIAQLQALKDGLKQDRLEVVGESFARAQSAQNESEQ